MCRRPTTVNPNINKTYKPKPKKIPRKRNLAQLSRPHRANLVKPREINEQIFPASTISQLNWKSESGRNLTQKAIDVAHSALSNLPPV